jgi:acetolactate synthase I/II/III large subunit
VKLSDYVFEAIADAGVGHVFFLPGGGAMHLVDSLGRCARLQPIVMLHEQAATIAAEAYSRVTGKLGAALVTTGPGGTNALTGVAGAWIESTPMVIISGQVKRADLMGGKGVRQLGVQEADIVSMARPVTKMARLVTDPCSIRADVEEALYCARHGRPGPVWLDVPLDVQAAEVDPADQIPFVPAPEAAIDAGPVAELILDELRGAERPLILAGNGVRLAGAVEDLRRLVEFAGVPLVTSRKNGIDMLPADHPLYFGRPGAIAHRYANFAVQTADLILVLGCRLDPMQVAYNWAGFGRNARKIMVDIDENEITKISPPVDVPVVADAGAVLTALLAGLRRDGGLGVAHAADRERWVERCRSWKAAYPVVEQRHRDLVGSVSTYVLAEELGARLTPDDTVVIGSSGAGIEAFMLAYSAPLGQRAFLTGGLGAMGFGLPASIGACLAAGGGRTVLVDGDGGFQLNIQELATLRRLSLPVKVFVLDNHGYGSIRNMQRRHFEGRLVGSDASSGLVLPDIVRVASAYGIRTAHAADHGTLGDVLRDVLQGDDPVICTIAGDEYEVAEPRVTSRVLPDGSMESRPIEDLAPLLTPEELAAALRTSSDTSKRKHGG